MASATDLFLSGDHEHAKQLVHAALIAQGFEVSLTPTRGFHARRGSQALTVLFGGLAGSRFQVTFLIEFMVTEQGLLVARISRNMTGGALKGGAIGAVKTSNAFDETVARLQETLMRDGAFVSRLDHQ